MNRIIGVTGSAGSGKDTVYQILKSEFPQEQVNRLAFADLLKKSAMRALALDDLHADDFKENATVEIRFGNKTVRTLSGREFLQRYGAEAHRDIFGDHFWVDAALYERLPDGATVITDVRYNNEAEAITAMGGVIWEVTRDGRRIDEVDHSSEQSIDRVHIDAVIENNGTKSDFRKKVLWAWGEQPLAFMEWSDENFVQRPATVPLFPDSLANQLDLFTQDKYTREELDHSFLKRKEIAELFNVSIEALS